MAVTTKLIRTDNFYETEGNCFHLILPYLEQRSVAWCDAYSDDIYMALENSGRELPEWIEIDGVDYCLHDGTYMRPEQAEEEYRERMAENERSDESEYGPYYSKSENELHGYLWR